MEIEDYGLWLKLYTIDKNSKGQYKLNGAWKHSNQIHVSQFVPPCTTLVLTTQNLEEFLEVGQVSGWKYICISFDDYQYVLVPEPDVKLTLPYILSCFEVINNTLAFKNIKAKFLEEYKDVIDSMVSRESREEQVRKELYKRFGLE